MKEHESRPQVSSLPAQIRRIVLIGFMGAGKSTVGAHLAARLGWPFEDADRFIEARAGCSIGALFRRDGEAAFRRLEVESIAALLERSPLVLATGGGALESPLTREALNRLSDTCIVFLDAPLDVLIARCLEQPGAAERPVLAEREQLEQRFTGRLPLYREAHLIVPTLELEPDALAESILEELRGRIALTPEAKSAVNEGTTP
ncbi:shikimate kinase [Paracidobacterium acidisoli]|uniref:Shikimate kinase n=1 Tax=Paracidobacterium acidisoli TaxID=2303751 RepID=A0A372IRR9_9BACT|nr:shikimate kinase [Paracidobacterium acidisoli]MBT9330527.1 shikimate kinase [Paracidobacterium acidisoli]